MTTLATRFMDWSAVTTQQGLIFVTLHARLQSVLLATSRLVLNLFTKPVRSPRLRCLEQSPRVILIIVILVLITVIVIIIIVILTLSFLRPVSLPLPAHALGSNRHGKTGNFALCFGGSKASSSAKEIGGIGFSGTARCAVQGTLLSSWWGTVVPGLTCVIVVQG